LSMKESNNTGRIIDLRSDTVTLPTEEMRKAIYEAELGDDVLGEDPTVNRLETMAAEKMGKEEALLVPSGTFANQLALFAHCNRGDEVILPENCHIVQNEAGAPSVLASVQLRSFMPTGDYPVWEDIEPRIRVGDNIHHPKTGLIVLENPLSNGDVMPLKELKRIYNNAKEYGVPVHLDGARIFNAALYLEVDAKEIARFTDSTMFCLSKSLSAPIGSLLTGTVAFIKKARKLRKLMGGGMRQAGIIAAAGIVAVEQMTMRLAEDHANAKRLAGILSRYKELHVESDKVKTNMVFARMINHLAEKDFVEKLKTRGVLIYPPRSGWLRFVTHRGIEREDIDYIESVLPEVMEEISITGGRL